MLSHCKQQICKGKGNCQKLKSVNCWKLYNIKEKDDRAKTTNFIFVDLALTIDDIIRGFGRMREAKAKLQEFSSGVW